MSGNVTIVLPEGGGFPGYVAEPGRPARAAIVVIQEIFGVNAGIRRKCDRLAEAGYLAIAPDLFWRLEPAVELDPDIGPQMAKAMDLSGRFDLDLAVTDIDAALATARTMLPRGGKVGVVGYCVGGRLAFRCATRTEVDAAVGYYGFDIDRDLGEKASIARPVMLHLAGEDHLIDEGARARMHAGLDPLPLVAIHDYPGVDHGFATEFGARRADAAAKLADERTARFFAQNLI